MANVCDDVLPVVTVPSPQLHCHELIVPLGSVDPVPSTEHACPLQLAVNAAVGGATVGRAVFEPGWRWAESVQPIAKTKSCEAPHFQYHVSGVLRIRMDDGTEFDWGITKRA